VTVLYGSSLSFLFPRSQFLFQGGDTAVAQPRYQCGGNRFGSSLTAWNFGAGPNTDLAVGVPREGGLGDCQLSVFSPCTITGVTVGPGAVEVLYGPLDLASGLNQKFHQTSDFPWSGISLQGVAEDGDGFAQTVY
jgi:hypothetical protein